MGGGEELNCVRIFDYLCLVEIQVTNLLFGRIKVNLNCIILNTEQDRQNDVLKRGDTRWGPMGPHMGT